MDTLTTSTNPATLVLEVLVDGRTIRVEAALEPAGADLVEAELELDTTTETDLLTGEPVLIDWTRVSDVRTVLPTDGRGYLAVAAA